MNMKVYIDKCIDESTHYIFDTEKIVSPIIRPAELDKNTHTIYLLIESLYWKMQNRLEELYEQDNHRI